MHLVVVGGGVTGLASAWRLAQTGAQVTLLEASDRLGGQVQTMTIGSADLDVGAEAMHLAAPVVGRFIDELSLRDDLVTALPGSSLLALPQGLRPLPAGIGPAGPTRIRPVLTSRTLSPWAMARAGLEPAAARLQRRPDLTPEHDLAVAEFTSRRFGRRVTETFIDPLLGSLHAGDVRRLSLKACTPSLVAAADQGRPLLKLRGRASGPPMSFVSWPSGLGRFVEALADAARSAGAELRTNTPVTAIDRQQGAVHLGDAQLACDAVVLAVPEPQARTLAGFTPLQTEPAASVATVVLGFDPSAVAGRAKHHTGILVPSTRNSLLKAATFLSTKWPQLRDDNVFWVRMSVGRAGQDRHTNLSDADLISALQADLRSFIGAGLPHEPRHALVRRWPEAMPQLTVGHVDRLTTIRAGLRAQPGIPLTLAGASYDGIGLASCLTSAQHAAEQTLQQAKDR